MAVYFVHNLVWKRWVVRYDDALGRAEELEATGDEELGEGFYVDPGRDLGHALPDQPASGELVGYYDTDDGPVFFRNAQRWPMGNRQFRSEVLRSRSGYEFRLWEREQLCLEVRYLGPPPDDYFWPEDEEYRDPFQWIARYMPGDGFYSRHITLTLEEARRILGGLDVDAVRRLEGAQQLRVHQAMVLLLEEGEAPQREAAADVLVKSSLGFGLFRRLVRRFGERGWDAGHPVVRVFQRHRDYLGAGGRATLRRCFHADPARQAALEPLLEPAPDR
jgi:hypothetical protein